MSTIRIDTVEQAEDCALLQEYLERSYKNDDEYNNVKNYLYECLDHDCYIDFDDTYTNERYVCFETEDDNGDYVKFTQGIYNTPQNNTFMYCYGKRGNGVLYEYNVCDACRGLDIYKREELIDAAYHCAECGKTLKSQDEFNFVPFATLCCDECVDESRNEFENGWYG